MSSFFVLTKTVDILILTFAVAILVVGLRGSNVLVIDF